MKTLAMFFLLCAGILNAAPQQEPVRIIKKVAPHYPAIVKAAGIEGMVWLKVIISESGKIDKIEVSKATDSVFVPVTIDAVKQWQFSPAQKDGKPIRAEVTIPFKFVLGPGSYKSGYKDDISESEHVALQILRGKFTPELRSRLDDSATVLTPGSKKKNLLSLLDDPAAATQLVEGSSMVIESTRAIPVVDGAMCYLLTTKSSRNARLLHHSIVFVRKADGWKITDWQVWE